ncbi:glycosyl transferase family group 2-domain-containing protein [Copromyces sp. CBS 386.78]|nr:glycosyl transferase family group 2-domain-containing protein [Copromyces sp. CBS 386.78]
MATTLPHVTVQCPVYKEGLAGVIAPTVKSIKHAISTYDLQGGAANMFINDDGLQLISEEDLQEGTQHELCKVEEKLSQIQRSPEWSQHDEAQAYDRALQQVFEENGRAWTNGNIRMGDYILLIDSDTRVPADCLLDTVSEMEQSPDIGIMQFSSGVMQVVYTYFENGITFVTNLIYSAIRYTVSNGDVAPFVGYNAILRWFAIQ